MKCNQSRPGFELTSPCPFPTTIAITPLALPNLRLWNNTRCVDKQLKSINQSTNKFQCIYLRLININLNQSKRLNLVTLFWSYSRIVHFCSHQWSPTDILKFWCSPATFNPYIFINLATKIFHVLPKYFFAPPVGHAPHFGNYWSTRTKWLTTLCRWDLEYTGSIPFMDG